jgi:hypothetical protein
MTGEEMTNDRLTGDTIHDLIVMVTELFERVAELERRAE